MQTPSLGILVCEKKSVPPFYDTAAFRQMAIASDRIGVRLFVFSPRWVQWTLNRTWGYGYDAESARWRKASFPLPDFVYDRYFMHKQPHRAIMMRTRRRWRDPGAPQWLSRGIGSKWDVHRRLALDSVLRPYLPSTRLLDPLVWKETLATWLETHKSAFLKPSAGKQGKGAMLVTWHPEDGSVTLRGRTRTNRLCVERFVRREDAMTRLEAWFAGRRYILQEALPLCTEAGEPFDLRVLLQRGESGGWRHTAEIVRAGEARHLTSNLHGGGRAHPADAFLARLYGEAASRRLIDTAKELSRRVPRMLEARYGRLIELGIDFGIDPEGRPWLLEVNSRPGKQAFAQWQENRSHPVLQPLWFVRYLWERQLRRSPLDESDHLQATLYESGQ